MVGFLLLNGKMNSFCCLGISFRPGDFVKGKVLLQSEFDLLKPWTCFFKVVYMQDEFILN